MTTKEEIIEQIKGLNENQLREVLSTIFRVKSRPHGEPGWKAIQHAREISFSPEDLAEMQAAIEETDQMIDDFPEIDLDA